MGRSKRLIKLADSWYSPKLLWGKPRDVTDGGRATEWVLGVYPTTLPNQTPNTMSTIPGVREVGISLLLKRETAQTAS